MLCGYFNRFKQTEKNDPNKWSDSNSTFSDLRGTGRHEEGPAGHVRQTPSTSSQPCVESPVCWVCRPLAVSGTRGFTNIWRGGGLTVAMTSPSPAAVLFTSVYSPPTSSTCGVSSPPSLFRTARETYSCGMGRFLGVWQWRPQKTTQWFYFRGCRPAAAPRVSCLFCPVCGGRGGSFTTKRLQSICGSDEISLEDVVCCGSLRRGC